MALSILENTKVWSDLITSYAINDIWRSIIRPGTVSDNKDPTQAVKNLLLNSFSNNPIKIGSYIRSAINEFYIDNNMLIVPYTKVLSKADDIQWSLKYTSKYIGRSVGGAPRDLSYLGALNYLQEKIIYTYSALYEIISTNFNDGDVLTAIFHKITPSGYHAGSTINAVFKSYKDKYNEIAGNRLRYTFDLTSADGEMELRQFVGGIVYYLTTFGATFLLQEGDNDVLAGNLMQLLSERHIQTSAVSNSLDFNLNTKGNNILSTYGSLWNREPTGVPIWTPGDQIPGWLVMLYTNEMSSVKSKFNSMFQLYGDYQIDVLKLLRDL